jgi:hypothetical protein
MLCDAVLRHSCLEARYCIPLTEIHDRSQLPKALLQRRNVQRDVGHEWVVTDAWASEWKQYLYSTRRTMSRIRLKLEASSHRRTVVVRPLTSSSPRWTISLAMELIEVIGYWSMARTEAMYRTLCVTLHHGDIAVSNSAGVHSCSIHNQPWAYLEAVMLHFVQ